MAYPPVQIHGGGAGTCKHFCTALTIVLSLQGLGQSVMMDMRMELLAPYAEMRPERDPPRVSCTQVRAGDCRAQRNACWHSDGSGLAAWYASSETQLSSHLCHSPACAHAGCRGSPGC